MNFNRMRALLLEHAIQGKLVPQLDDEPDVEQIGKTREEVPFDIPKKWKWLPLKVVCKDFLVPMRDKPTFSNNQMDTPWCRIEDIVEGKYLRGSKSARFLSEKTIQDMNLKVNPVGTVISACSASIGAAAVVETQCCTNQTFIGLVCDEQHLFNWYLYFVLKSAKQRLVDIGTGTTIKYISRKKYEEFLIPVPSLSEQRRIVAKLEESFAEIARAEKAYEELQTLAGVLRGQILQEAIQGKLVPQLVSDGVTKQIAEAPEEVPFDIPNTWSWIRGEELAVKRKTIDPSTLTNDEIELWSIPAYDAGVAEKVSPGDIGSSKKVVQAGDVLLAKIVPHIERVWIVSESANSLMKLASTEWLVYASELFLPEFMGLLFRSPYFRTKMMESVSGMGSLKRANPRTLAKVWLPVPPIKEQERIVIKVETLLKQVNLLLTK